MDFHQNYIFRFWVTVDTYLLLVVEYKGIQKETGHNYCKENKVNKKKVISCS